ncbi:MAG: conserved phage C-terminal domain-containing protein [Patescibacteria group bacterium]|nr:conserved phage C-terminal domain-containing protein [Patescibacteria group bacterium]
MKTDTWMPLYIGDYLGDTIGLSLAEHGAYLMAMMAYWRKGSALTNKEALGTVGEHKSILERFFAKKGDFWIHKRIEIELEKASIISSTNQERAKNDAEARWSATSNASSTTQEMHGESSTHAPSQSPSQSPSHSHNNNHYHKDARSVLHFLNENSRRHFRETDANLTFISSRLKEPEVDFEGCKKMILRQCKKWLDTEMAEYLRPETLFNKTKFDSYYAARDLDANPKPIARPAGGNF